MELEWWQESIFYQIFLRSFKDSNDDGIGDIQGLISKLDYIKDLGVDAIYITPFFPSPYFDSGFDVSDFYDVDSYVGELKDIDQLIETTHNKELKLIIDIPINHTSLNHKWFVESSSSKDNYYSDFYIWKDKIPNNWLSNFGGSSWTFCEKRNQYYMHSFTSNLPDLNWYCEALISRMLDIIRFYLDKGIDGIRLSCANLIIKDRDFRDNPKYPGTFINSYYKQRHIFDRNRPNSHRVLRRIRSLFNEYENRVLIGDIVVTPPGEPEVVASYYGMFNDEFHLVFDYTIANTKLTPKIIQTLASRWIDACDDSWPAWIFSSHDHKRLVTKFKKNFKKARLITMYLLTQRGSPFLYYGEELALEDSRIPKNKQKDLQRKKMFFFQNSRDGARGPMLWNKNVYGGFSSNEPYLPMGSIKKCVENQENDDYSILNYTKNLISFRKDHRVLIDGDFTFIDINDENIIAYIRTSNLETLLILLNFTRKKRCIKFKDLELPFIAKTALFSTNLFGESPMYDMNEILLNPFEGAIYSIDI